MTGPATDRPWAVVAGASGTLGAAVARALDAAGYRLFLLYHANRDRAEAVGASLGGTWVAAGADLGCWEAARTAVDPFIEEHGAPFAVVNCTGIRRDGLMAGQAAAEWRQTIEVNLLGSFHLSRAVLPAMLRARQGAIVHVVSPAGIAGNAGQTAYSASKAGMIGMVRSLAQECGRRNVTVNALSPGFMVSPMTEQLPGHVRDAIVGRSATRRLVEPEEVAAMVPAIVGCRSMTGQVVSVDGGLGI